MRGDTGFPVRLRFTKHGKVRFVSHRDIARAFERAFRVEALPLAFTQGFAPRPKVSFGLALSVGQESDAEYLDVELAQPLDPDRLTTTLSDALPEGITVTGAVALVERAPALQESITAVEWEMDLTTSAGEQPAADHVERLVAAALAAPALPVTRVRKGRESLDDIRPALRRAAVLGTTGTALRLGIEVATTPMSARPGEVLAALGGDLVATRVVRTQQWIERGGERLDPLDADARRALEARAS
jgi:radical SAM-linked protein